MKDLDGLKSILNAIGNGLANAEKTSSGTLLNTRQMRGLQRALLWLFVEPLVTVDKAVDVVMLLEDAGFNVEPSAFQFLLDALESLPENSYYDP